MELLPNFLLLYQCIKDVHLVHLLFAIAIHPLLVMLPNHVVVGNIVGLHIPSSGKLVK